MLSLITQYLLQHRRVAIPHVGSFELKMQSPQLDFAQSRIIPPVFVTEYSQSDSVPDHQALYFSSVRGLDRQQAEQDLSRFGQQLKTRVEQGGLDWKGFGRLRSGGGSLLFQPEDIRPDSLQSVPALRVIRPEAGHRVRVGEQDLSSREANELLSPTTTLEVVRKRSYAGMVGWTVLGLALALVIFFLYRNAFDPQAAGLRKRTSGWSVLAPAV